MEINNDEGGDQLINLLKDKFVASSEVNLDKLKEQATKQFANMQLDQPVTDSALQKVAMEKSHLSHQHILNQLETAVLDSTHTMHKYRLYQDEVQL